MKALDQIALFAFSLVMLFNVSAQEANEVLGVPIYVKALYKIFLIIRMKAAKRIL